MKTWKKIILGGGSLGVLGFIIAVFAVPSLQAPFLSTLFILGDEDQQLWAVKRLAKMEQDGLGGLAMALESESVQVRTEAMNELFRLGPKASPIAERLVPFLYNNDRYMDCAASACLAQFKERSAPFQEQLRRELDRKFGPERDYRELRKLEELLKYRGPVVACAKNEICSHKVRAIAEMGEAATESLETLIRVIEYGENDRLLSHAAYALGKMGPRAKKASSVLRRRLHVDYLGVKEKEKLLRLKKLDDESPDFEHPDIFFIYALWKIEGPSGIPRSYLKHLQSQNPGQFGADLPWLMRQMKGKVPESVGDANAARLQRS